jgi:flavin reductase (DIM6/NTAB) family NADH-FMN oxidoreductase RutF
MLFDFAELTARERHKLLISTVVPRPIAWVVTQSAGGQLNAAPFSFFNAFASDPPVVGIGMSSHAPDRPKDSRLNIKETGEFVVNLVSEDNARAMNVTAIGFDYGVDELAEAGLTTVLSYRVKPPRIAESPVALECKLLQIVDLGPTNGLVLGEVLAMHVRDESVLDAAKHYVDTPALKLISRMHGAGWYARTSDLFEMPRVTLEEWRRARRSP